MIETILLSCVGLSVYAAILVVARGLAFRTRIYRPMLLNIGLSLAPALALVMAVVVTQAIDNSTAELISLGLIAIVWLLLLPNAGYLVTELNLTHRRPDDPVPMWFDIVLLITLATSGVVNTLVSAFFAQAAYAASQYADVSTGLVRPDSLAVVAVVLLLVGFGVFLGREVRVNSWDVLRPWRLARSIVEALRGLVVQALTFSVLYAIFLALMYAVTFGAVILTLRASGAAP